jgi:copper homeostasis protein
MNRYLVECCANAIQSAIDGELGGANRVEFCANLEVGGISPSREDIQKAKKLLNIPLHVLIRLRSGDFIYSQNELSKILSDIQFCKTVGCEGVVIGVLKNGSINIKQTQ